ncbi:glycosyltransferase family 2 protein [Vibrio inusitatus]|nr:glycosyltransferase family 2 protein [Vibrio inusitatus]
MATYNGEAYITEQLQSIVDCRGFDKRVNRIIISDDGSTDGTKNIVKEFKSEAIEFYLNKGKKGVISNFNNAADQSNAKYVVFSDQDDVWLKNKIDILYKGITELEREDESKPCLFFTDLEVVGQSLEPIATSFWKHQKLDPRMTESFSSILVQNMTPGCAIIVNRALLDIAFPCPVDAVMHDWWLLLCAKTFGKTGFSESQTVKYRQHDLNTVGAKKSTFLKNVSRVLRDPTDRFDKIVQQSTLLAMLMPVNHEYISLIEKFSNIRALSISSRLSLYLSIVSPFQSFERKIALLTRLMVMK